MSSKAEPNPNAHSEALGDPPTEFGLVLETQAGQQFVRAEQICSYSPCHSIARVPRTQPPVLGIVLSHGEAVVAIEVGPGRSTMLVCQTSQGERIALVGAAPRGIRSARILAGLGIVQTDTGPLPLLEIDNLATLGVV